ncbi:DUF4296 domain-containing protein [Arenibacter sp. GZD96]|uniref:DUF4296 domain-containing protein n=1 Tax=Aurantibrevibacter litoralis TaxID=3106030 RepID=UPI002AFF5E9D|nr:DUF4296 domain-containing protein [Arenibacter sp. GZD-96]MEA1787166.1 DUF4296 domain-containing protein [Arenibacter sp. GZD-96]
MRAIFLLLLLVAVVSCNEKLVEKPAGLIGKEKMVEILYDLSILNSAQNTNAAILQEQDIAIMPYIYKKHVIDSVQLARSDLYYASIPLEYEAIYKEIVAKLEEDQKKLEELRTKGPDSTAIKGQKVNSTLLDKK